MTRINLVPPTELYDQHLLAEYRETRLLAKNMHRYFKANNTKKNIPKQFTLNTGHCLFFKDKGLYIHNRYDQLKSELRNRGYHPQFEELDVSAWPVGFYNDWTPTERDMNIIRDRISEKFKMKPMWYRYYGKPVAT
ncbi:MAG: endonuclease V [Methylotenera sp.]|nr:MAG: endonuclease V [Methylotenera sp.]